MTIFKQGRRRHKRARIRIHYGHRWWGMEGFEPTPNPLVWHWTVSYREQVHTGSEGTYVAALRTALVAAEALERGLPPTELKPQLVPPPRSFDSGAS
jgi:hypothetical protein